MDPSPLACETHLDAISECLRTCYGELMSSTASGANGPLLAQVHSHPLEIRPRWVGPEGLAGKAQNLAILFALAQFSFFPLLGVVGNAGTIKCARLEFSVKRRPQSRQHESPNVPRRRIGGGSDLVRASVNVLASCDHLPSHLKTPRAPNCQVARIRGLRFCLLTGPSSATSSLSATPLRLSSGRLSATTSRRRLSWATGTPRSMKIRSHALPPLHSYNCDQLRQRQTIVGQTVWPKQSSANTKFVQTNFG